MMVKELIEKLKEYDAEDEVVFVTYHGDNEYIFDMATSEPAMDRVYIFLEDLNWLR